MMKRRGLLAAAGLCALLTLMVMKSPGIASSFSKKPVFMKPGLTAPVVFLPDGLRLIAVDNKVHELKLFEILSGRELKSFKGGAHTVIAAAVSPDGKLVASCGEAGEVKLWNLETGKLLHSFTISARSKASAVIFTPDSKKLMAGFVDDEANKNGVRVWHASSGKLERTIETKSEPLYLAIDWQGRKLAATVCAESGMIGGCIDKGGESLCWDGWGCLRRGLEIYDLTSAKMENAVKGGNLIIAAFNPELTVISPQWDDAGKELKIIDVKTGKTLSSIKLDKTGDLHFSDDLKIFAVVDDNNLITLYETGTGKKLEAVPGPSPQEKPFEYLTVAGFSPDRRYLATVSDEATIRVWMISAIIK